MSNKDIKGSIRIADDVIIEIVRTAALEAEGITAIAAASAKSARKRSNGLRSGIAVRVDGRNTVIDLAVNVQYGCRIQDAASDAQLKIKSAVEEMTGLNADNVNIYVRGIQMPKNQVPEDTDKQE